MGDVNDGGDHDEDGHGGAASSTTSGSRYSVDSPPSTSPHEALWAETSLRTALREFDSSLGLADAFKCDPIFAALITVGIRVRQRREQKLAPDCRLGATTAL